MIPLVQSLSTEQTACGDYSPWVYLPMVLIFGVKGLITGSGWQLLSQFIGCIVLMIWTLGLGYLLFYILRKTVGLRVPVSEENTGIVVYEHGITCYPGFN